MEANNRSKSQIRTKMLHVNMSIGIFRSGLTHSKRKSKIATKVTDGREAESEMSAAQLADSFSSSSPLYVHADKNAKMPRTICALKWSTKSMLLANTSIH